MESERTERELRNVSRGIWALVRSARGSLVNRSLLLAFSLVVVDLLLVSYMQPTTAYALIQHSAPLALLSGVLLSTGPWLLQLAFIYFVLAAAFDLAAGHSPRLATHLFFVIGTWAMTALFVDSRLALSPAQVVCLALAASSLGIGGAQLTRGSRWNDESLVSQIGVGTLFLGLVFVGWYTGGRDVRESLVRPYLPAEVVSVQTEGAASHREIGYVLSSDATWTILMREKDRHVVVVRTEAVLDRLMCETGLDHRVRPAERLIDEDPGGYGACSQVVRER